MHQRNMLLGMATVIVALGIVPAGYVYAESATSAEEHAVAARKQAELARESAERAAREAEIAEKHAARERQQSTSARRTELEHELAELQARETKRGFVLTLGDVLFAPDQAQLTPNAMRKLHPLVTLLKEQPQRSIHIEGYADSRGTEAYNLDLSRRRAETVRDFLIEQNISPTRIIARGYGEAAPVASNITGAGRQENRRVEVIVPRADKPGAADMR